MFIYRCEHEHNCTSFLIRSIKCKRIYEQKLKKHNYGKQLSSTSAVNLYFFYNTTVLNHFVIAPRALQHTCLTNISTTKNMKYNSFVSLNNIYMIFFQDLQKKKQFIGSLTGMRSWSLFIYHPFPTDFHRKQFIGSVENF